MLKPLFVDISNQGKKTNYNRSLLFMESANKLFTVLWANKTVKSLVVDMCPSGLGGGRAWCSG